MSKEVAATTKRTRKPAATEPEPVKKAAPAKRTATASKSATEPAKKVPAKRATAKPATGESKKVPAKPATPGAKAGKPRAGSSKASKPPSPSQEERQRWIATAAYHRAEKRGFVPGYEMQDWLDAEAEINALIGEA